MGSAPDGTHLAQPDNMIDTFLSCNPSEAQPTVLTCNSGAITTSQSWEAGMEVCRCHAQLAYWLASMQTALASAVCASFCCVFDAGNSDSHTL
jgi:hypothetical protein